VILRVFSAIISAVQSVHITCVILRLPLQLIAKDSFNFFLYLDGGFITHLTDKHLWLPELATSDYTT